MILFEPVVLSATSLTDSIVIRVTKAHVKIQNTSQVYDKTKETSKNTLID